MDINEFLKCFKGVKPLNEGWFALCPAHDDTKPSLSIGLGKDNMKLLNCHTGCKLEAIVSAAGLNMNDLRGDSFKSLTHSKPQTTREKENLPPAPMTSNWEAIVNKTNDNTPLISLFTGRNISAPTVEKALREKKICFVRHKKKPSAACKFSYLDSDGVTTIQALSIDGKNFPGRDSNKSFFYGSKSSLGFFQAGTAINEAKQIVLVEAVINALSVADCIPEICCLAMGSTATYKKIADLLPYADKEIICFFDNDPAGCKAIGNVSQILNSAKSVTWSEDASPKMDANDLLKSGNREKLIEMINEATPIDHEAYSEEQKEWARAREIFPKCSFPWEVLPDQIAESLHQLARACATSPASLPGAALAIFSSILGPTVKVSPKTAWKEPLIFWFGDIRESGQGKTPAARMLCKVLYEAQSKADKDYKQRLEDELSKKKNEQRPVPRSKSYFITQLTVESLRYERGGVVCVLDELSSFINGQNQYKSKGTDREAWICLHDGNPARILRTKESYTLTDLCVSIFGGIQPAIWKSVFGSDDGLFIVDGTVFRFLVTYEGNQFFELTKESWDDGKRYIWETTLSNAMEWSNSCISVEGWEAVILDLSEDAKTMFFDWCNDLKSYQYDLPKNLRGYIPKIISSALRLSGALYCMEYFVTVKSFSGCKLGTADIQKGIDTAMFYAGHATHAMEALCKDEAVITSLEINDQIKHLAKTLESLNPELDSGRLAVGYIQEKFNEPLSKELKINSPHAMGALIRNCGLTIPKGHFRANKRAKVKCLLWDKKTDSFLEHVHKVLFVHNSINHAGLEARTLKTQCPQSPQNTQNTSGNLKAVDFVDIEKTKSSPANLRASSDVDKGDFEDIVSKENKKTEPEAREFDEGII